MSNSRREIIISILLIISLFVISVFSINYFNNSENAMSTQSATVNVIALNLDTKKEINFGKQEYKINDYPPSIYNDNVVWVETKSLYMNSIAIGNFTTGKKTIITSGNYYYFPNIYRNYIAWVGTEKNLNTDGHIYLYNISSKTIIKITKYPNQYYEPKISNNYLVWYTSNFDNQYNASIFIYNIQNKTIHNIKMINSNIYGIAIEKKNIFYINNSNRSFSLRLYNITDKKDYLLLDNIDSIQHGLSVDKDIIVWSGINITIYNYQNDFITYLNYSFVNLPQISGRLIVYMDSRTLVSNGVIKDALLYNLFNNTTTRIVHLSNNEHTWEQHNPGINGDWIVWFDGEKAHNSYFNDSSIIPYFICLLLLFVPILIVMVLYEIKK